MLFRPIKIDYKITGSHQRYQKIYHTARDKYFSRQIFLFMNLLLVLEESFKLLSYEGKSLLYVFWVH